MNTVRRWWAPGGGVAVTLLWLLVTLPLIERPLVFRGLALLLFATSVMVRIASGYGRNRRRSLGAFVLAFIVGTSPVDISLRNYPGGARLVPFVVGLPAPATFEAGRRGEVMLAGCIATGFDPEWVLVW